MLSMKISEFLWKKSNICAKIIYNWARSSVVEHLPFKQGVEGSIPSGLTISNFKAPSSSGLGHQVFILKIAGSNPAGVTN